MIKRGGKLHPAARHVRMRGRRGEGCIARDFFGGLGNDLAVGADQPGLDRGLCLGAAVE